MMRKIYNFTILLLALFIFASCEGDQGEVGPEGPIGEQGEPGADGQDGEDGLTYETSGFIKGTFEGTRKDGIGFSEDIEFTEKRSKEGFEVEGEFHKLAIIRNLSSEMGYYNSAHFNISIFDLYGTPVVKADNMMVEFEKEKEGNKLFRLYADFFDRETIITNLIDKNNTDYEFLNEGRNSQYLYENSTSHRIFTLTDGSKVKYEDSYANYSGEYHYGSFVSLTTVDGTVITTGTKYANLELRNEEFTAFYENGVNIGSQEIIPADTYEINNFVYNNETNIVTFDFIYNINGGRNNYNNSTNNELVFTGSVEAEVYSEIMSRTTN